MQLVSSCFLGQQSFDLNSVLYDEIRLELNSTRYTNLEDRAELEKAAEVIRGNRPELQWREPVRQRQDLLDKAQMISKLGRTFPDTITFMRREQRAKRKNLPFGLEQLKNKKGKKIRVSTKGNAFMRDRSTKDDANKDRTRSQSESRVFDRKNREKPFWRPTPKRHASAESLNKGSSRTVGSGRVNAKIQSDILKVRAGSVETLLLLKSYETSCRKRDDRSSFGPRRGGSLESLSSKASFRERRTPRTTSSEQVSRDHRQFGNDREGSFQTRRASEVEPCRNWRRDGNARPEGDAPRSSFFQSFSTGEASSRTSSASEHKSPFHSRPSSRSSMNREPTSPSLSRRSRGQGDGCGSQPCSSFGNRESSSPRWNNWTRFDDRVHADAQSLSSGRANYVPRGGSYSRGGLRNPRGRGLTEPKSDLENSFGRLNLR